MDYKELIEILENQEDRVVLEYIEDAATAIKTLLAEREDILCEFAAVSDCTSCKFYDGDYPECVECGYFNQNWQWRGPQKEA